VLLLVTKVVRQQNRRREHPHKLITIGATAATPGNGCGLVAVAKCDKFNNEITNNDADAGSFSMGPK
jgi:hypothetical protein